LPPNANHDKDDAEQMMIMAMNTKKMLTLILMMTKTMTMMTTTMMMMTTTQTMMIKTTMTSMKIK